MEYSIYKENNANITSLKDIFKVTNIFGNSFKKNNENRECSKKSLCCKTISNNNKTNKANASKEGQKIEKSK